MPEQLSSKNRLRKPRGPGRPEGTSVIRDEILDAAEAVFSSLGYAGTSLREVAEKAKVTQALISYYFGSKFGLFEQAFLRRSQPISLERIKRLEELERAGSATSRPRRWSSAALIWPTTSAPPVAACARKGARNSRSSSKLMF